MRFEKGQKLHTPLYEGKILFLLLRGRVRIYKVVGGQEITLAVVTSGEMFGEAAFTSRKLPGVYAEAMEPSDVALLSVGAFGRLVSDRPEVGLKAIELLVERLSFYEGKLADIGLKEVPARLASLLLHLVESEGIVTREGGYAITTRYTHEQLGAMIGAKRVAVTRALGEFRRAGAVEPKRQRLYVTDLKVLELAAGG